MSENAEVRQMYIKGYEAFEQGDFAHARSLADACLAASPRSAYWYAGAWGLRCWIACFEGDGPALEQSAATLLALQPELDKHWFDGIAWFTQGVAKRQAGQRDAARALFVRAAEQYEAQPLLPGQPAEWQDVIDYFATACRWAAGGAVAEWEEFLTRFERGADVSNALLGQLAAAARVMLRYAEGETVQQNALALLGEGVSRTFLALVLLA